MDRIEFDSEELNAATNWHGGQGSMLYAIASTGALSRGTESYRPRIDCNACSDRGRISPSDPCGTCRGAKMTDDQWLAYLAEKLESEASASADDARLRAKRASHARRTEERDEMRGHAAALDSIAAKCRAAIAQLTGTFTTWADVLASAQRGDQLLYGAPMDAASAYPFRHVRVVRVFKNGKLRIDPMSNQADPFTADASYLDRFRCKTA